MYKNVPFYLFLNNYEKSTNFNNFWYATSSRNWKSESYRLPHLTYKLWSQYLGKCKSYFYTAH